MYIIMKGYFPRGSLGLLTGSWEEISTYSNKVDQLFKDGVFPDVTGLKCDHIIRGCWAKEVHSAEEVVNRLSSL
jgi:hypothetical protein